MPINIYSVANHLAENNWTLISTEYKNLNTELEMKCPEGHLQKQTYGQWRKHMLCEQCMAGDPYKSKKIRCQSKRLTQNEFLGQTPRRAQPDIQYMIIVSQFLMERIAPIVHCQLKKELTRLKTGLKPLLKHGNQILLELRIFNYRSLAQVLRRRR